MPWRTEVRVVQGLHDRPAVRKIELAREYGVSDEALARWRLRHDDADQVNDVIYSDPVEAFTALLLLLRVLGAQVTGLTTSIFNEVSRHVEIPRY